MTLPPALPNPCDDCPWRREAMKGWLGPSSPDEWIEAVHSDAAIACHKTIGEDGEYTAQCTGAAIYRANVGKLPRNREVARAELPDAVRVFASDAEFHEHHDEMYGRFFADADG